MDNPNTYLEWCSASIGQLVDRTIGDGDVLGCAWLIKDNTAVTCAHLLVPYRNHLQALMVRFPASGQEWGIREVSFHHKFDQKQAAQLSKRSPSPGAALQSMNVAVATLSDRPATLTQEFKEEVNQLLTLPTPAKDKGLSGSLDELDLALVVQTLANARKQGTLTICDDRNRPVARFFCKDGKVLHAHFGELINETAIYQFVSQHMSGRFYFTARNEPDWPVDTPIARPTDMLLIEAHRRVDEIPKLLLDLSGEKARFKRLVQEPSVNGERNKTVDRIWPLLNGKTAVGQMWRAARIDDYSIFTAVGELLRAKNIEEIPDGEVSEGPAPRVMDVASDMPLASWDEINAVTVEPVAAVPQVHSGYLLGSLRPGDPFHLLHNMELPPNCAGLPLFKQNKVIGMHCGTLPPDPKATALSNLNQLIWVEAAYDTLDGDDSDAPAAQERQERIDRASGTMEVAVVECPRCGKSSLDSAKFCKSCGTQLFRDASDFEQPEEFQKKSPTLKIVIGVVVFVLLIVGAEFANLMIKPVPQAVATDPISKAEVHRVDPKTAQWSPVRDLVVKNGETIRLMFTPMRAGHFYVLFKGTRSQPQLIYPESWEKDTVVSPNTLITIPEQSAPTPGQDTKFVAIKGLDVSGPPGNEQLLMVESDEPSSMLKNPAEAAKVFDSSVEMLTRNNEARALVVPPAAYDKDVFSDKVYLQMLQIQHAN